MTLILKKKNELDKYSHNKKKKVRLYKIINKYPYKNQNNSVFITFFRNKT